MSIEDTRVVDFVTIDPLSDEIVLSVSDHLPWNDEAEHLLLLEEKLNSYIAFFESGELAERYPESQNRRIRIEVVGQYELTPAAEQYFRQANEVLAAAGAPLRFRQLGGRAPS